MTIYFSFKFISRIKFNSQCLSFNYMTDLSEAVYVTEDGEEVPIAERAETGNIQEVHTDWFKQNDIYKRHMSLSYLPNDVSIADLRALTHADGFGALDVTISNHSDGADTVQTALLAAQMSALGDVMRESKTSEKARTETLSDLADETAKQVDDISVDASVLFLIEAECKNKLDEYTSDIRDKANEIGAEMAAIEESPENKIITMDPEIPVRGDFVEEYCITVDAATAMMMQMLKPPQELLNELYEDPGDTIYLL